MAGLGPLGLVIPITVTRWEPRMATLASQISSFFLRVEQFSRGIYLSSFFFCFLSFFLTCDFFFSDSSRLFHFLEFYLNDSAYTTSSYEHTFPIKLVGFPPSHTRRNNPREKRRSARFRSRQNGQNEAIENREGHL